MVLLRKQRPARCARMLDEARPLLFLETNTSTPWKKDIVHDFFLWLPSFISPPQIIEKTFLFLSKQGPCLVQYPTHRFLTLNHLCSCLVFSQLNKYPWAAGCAICLQNEQVGNINSCSGEETWDTAAATCHWGAGQVVLSTVMSSHCCKSAPAL